MKLYQATLICLLCVADLTSPSAQAEEASADPISALKDWADRNADLLDSGTRYQGFQASLKRDALNVEKSRLESPWDLQANGNRQDARPLFTQPDSPTQSSFQLQPQLIYSAASSLTTTLSYTGVYQQFNNEAALGTPNGRVNFGQKQENVDANVTYDVVKGGDQSPARIDMRTAEFRSKAQLYQDEDAKMELRISFYKALVDYYVATCKERLLGSSRSLVETVVRNGNLQLKAHLISQTELLTFSSLSLSLRRQELAQHEALRQIAQLFDGLGPTIRAALAAKKDTIVACDFQTTIPTDRDNAQGNDAAKLAASLPSVKAAEAQLTASELSIVRLRRNRLPSVGPFAAADYQLKTTAGGTDAGYLTLGVALDWKIPVKLTYVDEQSYIQDAISSRLARDAAKLDAEVRIKDLFGIIAYNVEYFQIAKDSLRDANLLIRADQVGLRVKSLDILSYSNAIQSASDLRQGLSDSAGALVKATEELRVLRTESKTQ